MKDFAKDSIVKVRNHVKRQKFAYLWGGVAIAAIALQQANKNDFYKFLTEKGIDIDEYLIPEYYEEKKAS